MRRKTARFSAGDFRKEFRANRLDKRTLAFPIKRLANRRRLREGVKSFTIRIPSINYLLIVSSNQILKQTSKITQN